MNTMWILNINGKRYINSSLAPLLLLLALELDTGAIEDRKQVTIIKVPSYLMSNPLIH